MKMAATGLPCFIIYISACVACMCVKCMRMCVEVCTRAYTAGVHDLQFSLTAVVASNSCYAQKFGSYTEFVRVCSIH